MRVQKCDVCGKEQPKLRAINASREFADGFDWVFVVAGPRTAHSFMNEEFDICSMPCLMRWADARAERA